MSEQGDLYSMDVQSMANGERLISVTGSRETVLDMALRVILDSAPRWDSHKHVGYRPTFTVNVIRVTRR